MRPPTYARGWSASPISSGSGTFPFYAPIIEFWTDEVEDEPPWSWLRRGIPFDLMGFGYDGLHEMWNGYREGLSAMALLVKPAGSSTTTTPTGCGWPGWSRPPNASRKRHCSEDPPGRHTSGRPHRGAQGDMVRGGGTGLLPGSSPRPATSSSTTVTTTGTYDGFADPWEDDIIAEGTEEWRKASALMDPVTQAGRLAGGRPSRPLRRDAGLRRSRGSPTKNRRDTTMSNDSRFDPMVPAGRKLRPAQGRAEECSWRSTARPSCCGALRTTPPGSGPSRRTRSPTCSPSTWGSPRGCCRRKPSGGTRARPGRWWPSGGRRRSGPWPCNRRRSGLPPGSGFPCRGWSSSARRAGRPGSTPQRSGPADPEQHLFRAPAFNVFRDGRVCPGSHRFPEEVGPDTGRLLPVLLLAYRRHPGPLEEAPRKPALRYGRR